MGGGRPVLFISACLLLLQLRPLSSFSASSGKPMCREEERSALLGFKNSFFNETNCGSSKMTSWKAEEGKAKAGDCCDWDGVTCDVENGHVIGLDLSASCLVGRIDSESSIFDLIHLQELNLAQNSFEGSRIPGSLANMTSLRTLVLSKCGLSGEFPDSVLALPQLESLDVSENDGLTGYLTGFNRGSPIKSLILHQTNFTGELPVWLGNLSYLTEIDLNVCGFWGEIPPSIGDLTDLISLNLGSNRFNGPIPSSLGNLTNLTGLNLNGNRLSGEIPSSLGNLIWLDWLVLSVNQLDGEIPSSLMQISQLSELDLSENMLTGSVPSSISNLTRLTRLSLSRNKLLGPPPESIFRLPNLEILDLRLNHMIGEARIDLLLELKRVTYIDLSSNEISSVIFPEPNANVSQLKILSLNSCNVTEFPQFLKRQENLIELRLSNNKISGEIPEWLLQKTSYLDLSFNYIQGTLSIPPSSITYLLLSNNRLSGQISSSICKLENIIVLNLANNNFTGVLPSCFGSFSYTIVSLSLNGNNLRGGIPEFYSEELRLVDLSSNSFEGPLPRSLMNCPMLTYVNFGGNKIMDTFPSWLGLLPSLKVLMLHSNRFYGVMKAPRNDSLFPSLRVITLSENNLGGILPADYFACWKAMKYSLPDDNNYGYTFVTMTIMDKGIEREFIYTKGYFTLVDLSSNNFSGTIPNSIGDDLLKLHTLNLSNNDLSGPIPLSLVNLKNLEVLDLSRNRLSGVISGRLTQMTSLNHFNVSYNNLSGSIPEGNQFGTFENTSYIGNPELCGNPLTKKCGNPPQPPPSPGGNPEEKSNQQLGIVWITALVGLAGGLVVGVALEQAFGADVLYWLARKWQKYRIGIA